MYKIIEPISFKNQREAAKRIGITPESLCRILNGKTGTTKMTATCIVNEYGRETKKRVKLEEYFTLL